jgi:signal transduction histidine kinase
MMILYSLSVYFQGGRNEFLFYSGYAFFIGFMLFTKALYNYRTEKVSYFLEEYLDFILQCLGIIFYMIFMQKFLVTIKEHRFLHRLYNLGILLLLISIIFYSFFHYFTDNYPAENLTENGTKLLLLVMIIIFLGYSIQHWSNKLFRYLFWGNLLFLLFSLLSLTLIIAPQLLPLNGLAANSLIYYKAGLFFELVFFLAGLTYKNRRRIIEETKERETLKAQNMLKEYEKEIAVYKAQQEERQRISADMHDELGSGMTAIRLMSEIARNKMKGNTPVEIEKISRSADDVLNKMNAIIWSMNSSNDTLDNLVSYIRAWSLEYFENTPVHCKINTPVSIPEKELTGDKRRNLFLCIKETLNNVLKHAQATEVIIDITVNDKLAIRISDNGKGIDLEKLRQFGNGLKNISRRMESIGGSFSIENNEGTVTTLTLPL